LLVWNRQYFQDEEPVMQKLSHRRQSFEGFTLDRTRGCLLRGTQEIRLPPKPFDALKYLVDNAGRLVSKAELIQTLWPDTAVTDDSLVQCLMEVRRALGDGAQQIIKTVPRRGYIFDKDVIDSGAVGQVMTYTEETAGVNVIIEEEETVGQGVIERQALPAAADFAGIERLNTAIKEHRWVAASAVLTVAVVAVALVYFSRPAEAIDSVAVMPFENVSGDPNTEYLSEGISESITNNLSPLLKVSSVASVMRYKGKQTDPRVVGHELNVQAVLIARLLQHGEDVSISAELVDARDNHRLWGQKYNSRMADIVSLQEKISRDVSQKLRPRLSGAQQKQITKHSTESTEALEAYWQGRYHMRRLTPQGLQESIPYFNRAIELDPSFALPYAGLASSYSMLGARGTLSPMEAYPKVVTAASKALELDDTLAEAHYAQAKVKRDDWDLVNFEKELKRAIELNRNYIEAHHNYSHLLIALGRPSESLSESKRLLEIDPLDLTLNAHLGWYYLATRQYDQAIEKCLGTLGMGENFWAHYYLGQAYEQTRRYEEAISEFKKAIPLSKGNPEATAALGYAYAVSGRQNEARKVLEELNDYSKQRYVSPDYRALIYAGLGDRDAAFEQLQKAYDDHAGQLIYINVDQRFDSLHSDPRFQELCRRVGLSH
jgi:DNA-binding winged helix-turn-helix (wHTH) protein/TolB-like protein/Flp pilus assembly protein TadD